MKILLPRVLAVDEYLNGCHIRQIGEPARVHTGSVVPFTLGKLKGHLVVEDDGQEVLVVPDSKVVPEHFKRVLKSGLAAISDPLDLIRGTWRRHPVLAQNGHTAAQRAAAIAAIKDSWHGAFSYAQENPATNTPGLRPPQLGALHAVMARWTVSDQIGTVVMPTGTGKTEVMLAILTAAICDRVLVVVPTDALRTQIAEKFLTLGMLAVPGSRVLAASARQPIVGVLRNTPKTAADVEEVFQRCQVVVTTSSIAGRADESVRAKMAEVCSDLFIDEAHHAEAPTWDTFRQSFRHRRILQFTATPFREDGKPLEGDIIYRYPLKLAQQEGYFKPISFRPVIEFNPKRIDEAIAETAVAQLAMDYDKGHILMARVGTIERAKQVFAIYERHKEFKAVQLHSGITSQKERDGVRQQILAGTARIIVCVDMLGEGFDLPELKIAAFHDIRKTLAVTLQLAGRFTRSREDLGNATFIANVADVHVQDELRKLYARDPDWNVLLPEFAENAIGQQVQLQEFLKGFTDFTEEIPLKTVRPATSAVVYKTSCVDWQPKNFIKGLPSLNACEQIHESVNHGEHTIAIVTAKRVELEWTDVEKLFGWDWELYVIVWSPEQNLLFINCSTNAGEYKALAQAICGDDVELIHDQVVFRVFHGVNRLKLQTVGLTEMLGRNVRFTNRMGSDVESALSDFVKGSTRKSVLAGTGFEGGERVNVGASRKGRIWSFRREYINEFAQWCKRVGAKLLDQSIDPDSILEGTLSSEIVDSRPEIMPIAADWPEEIYRSPELVWSVGIDGESIPISDVTIGPDDPGEKGPIKLRVFGPDHSVVLRLELFTGPNGADFRFVQEAGFVATIQAGGAISVALADFFSDDPPFIWFADGSSLIGNRRWKIRHSLPPFDSSKIVAWDWAGVNIKRESQGTEKDRTTVQGRVIERLAENGYDLIFDDDNSGEIADVIAVRVFDDPGKPNRISLELYHCKFSMEDTPGRRIGDVYEVSGQTFKSVSWMISAEKRSDIFTHLMRRESDRLAKGLPSRIEVGDFDKLHTLREMSRSVVIEPTIFIVQPGLISGDASIEQLQILGVAKNYLSETYQIPLEVIGSPKPKKE